MSQLCQESWGLDDGNSPLADGGLEGGDGSGEGQAPPDADEVDAHACGRSARPSET